MEPDPPQNRRHAREQLAELLRMVGRRLAAEIPRTGPVAERRQATVEIVRDAERDAPFKKDPQKQN
jgi:hypothetical protein